MDMYPKAKVILNQRKSGKAWADSIRNSLAFFGSKTYLLIGYPIQTDRLHYQIHQNVYKSLERRFKLEPEKFYSVEFYDKHNQWVRDEAAKRGKEVLEFQAEHGWKPICEFLGKPPPPVGVPFPHLNDQRDHYLEDDCCCKRIAGLVSLGSCAIRSLDTCTKISP
jgi:hypothetical protein